MGKSFLTLVKSRESFPHSTQPEARGGAPLWRHVAGREARLCTHVGNSVTEVAYVDQTRISAYLGSVIKKLRGD